MHLVVHLLIHLLIDSFIHTADDFLIRSFFCSFINSFFFIHWFPKKGSIQTFFAKLRFRWLLHALKQIKVICMSLLESSRLLSRLSVNTNHFEVREQKVIIIRTTKNGTET